MTDPLELRRRRAAWRANHRGTKELDLMIGRYAEAHLATMTEPELARFEAFMDLSEPELQQALLASEAARDQAFADVINRVRVFHGMAAGTQPARTPD